VRPRVSVLMPTYGQAHFIARAIESLLRQSYGRWELVVVDDGSPDATNSAVEPYLSDERIRYHRCEENQGLGAALNAALSWPARPTSPTSPQTTCTSRSTWRHWSAC
jgi:glycosyltransferase involved in cell wall biosynthesis